MTAYGAVNSLRNTIDYILHSFHFNLVEPSPHIIQLAYQELDPLQEILERLDSTSTSRSRKKVNALDGRIKELIWEFEDLLECLLYQQILSQFCADQVDEEMKERVLEFGGLLESLPSQPQFIFQSPPPHHTTTRRRRRQVVHKHKRRKIMKFSIDLQILQHDVGSFMERLKDMEEEYINEVDNMPQDDDNDSISSRSGTKSKMIGLSDQLERLKRQMAEDGINNYMALVGTAGVGKTALAEVFFKDPEILSRFEHRAWVTVGRKSQFDEVLQGILAQMFGDDELAYLDQTFEGKKYLSPQMFEITQDDKIDSFGDETWERQKCLAQMFGIILEHEISDYGDEPNYNESDDDELERKKCLIVLDDVWEKQILASLLRSLLNMLDVQLYILVTTRDRSIIRSMIYPNNTILVRFLNEEESKELLCEKVFGEKGCPFQLDKAATKIAKNCEGVPLAIVTVADILSKAQNTDHKYWDDAAEMRNSVFMDAYNEISKVLFPSYDYLPQYLKMPFLYMGVFPPDYDIPLSKIMNMLATEGWSHNTNKEQSLEDSVWECLKELCTNRNLVLFNKRTINRTMWLNCKFKTCRLHSSWRHMCRGEARKNKFYHVLKKLVEGLEDGVKGQHCLCLENNLLFGIKEFCNSLRLNCASSTRSLLFLAHTTNIQSQ